MEKKNPSCDYDVIIVGAGPAGLSLGSELAKDFKILVIDMKKEAEETERSWFVPELFLKGDPVTKDPDPNYLGYVQNEESLKQFFPEGVKRLLINTWDPLFKKNEQGNSNSGRLTKSWFTRRKYRYVDEPGLLKHWAEQINSGSNVLMKHLYLDHKLVDGIVHVKIADISNEGKKLKDYTCRLLIDASGFNSQIRKKYDIRETENYWWSVYGAIVAHPEGTVLPSIKEEEIDNKKIGTDEQLVVGDYMLWHTFESTNSDPQTSLSEYRPVFEYEVFDKDRYNNHYDERIRNKFKDKYTSFPMILYLAKDKVDYKLMQAEFNHILRNEETTKGFHDTEIVENKWGWYPSGDFPDNPAEDHVLFIGDSGGWTTPCGWGFTIIMATYLRIFEEIKEALNKNKLSKKELAKAVELDTAMKLLMYINQLVVHILSHGTVDQLNRFINVFDDIKDKEGKTNIEYCEKVFMCNLTTNDLKVFLKYLFKNFSVWEVIKMFPRKDYLYLIRFGFLFSLYMLGVYVRLIFR